MKGIGASYLLMNNQASADNQDVTIWVSSVDTVDNLVADDVAMRALLLQNLRHCSLGFCTGFIEVDSFSLVSCILYQVSCLHKHVVHLIYLQKNVV
jgi:hypothetical protein